MSVQTWNKLLTYGLVLILGIAGYFGYGFYQDYAANQEVKRLERIKEQTRLANERKEAERIAREKEAKVLRQLELKQEFEVFLNDFLNEVRAKIRKYRESRRIMDDLLKPANLRSRKFVKENRGLGEATIMSLSLQADAIMTVFDKAQKRFETEFQQFENEEQAKVNKSWAEVWGEQQERYKLYFATDKEVLQSIQDLLVFYRTYMKSLRVDFEKDIVYMADKQKEIEHRNLLIKYNSLLSLQAEMFMNFDEEINPPADSELDSEVDFLGR